MLGGVSLTTAIILWIIPIFVSRSIGAAKNRDGWMYGLFLSWLGVLIVYMLPPLPDYTTVTCSACGERARASTAFCSNCGAKLA